MALCVVVLIVWLSVIGHVIFSKRNHKREWKAWLEQHTAKYHMLEFEDLTKGDV